MFVLDQYLLGINKHPTYFELLPLAIPITRRVHYDHSRHSAIARRFCCADV